ncbi:MAG TPA: adenylate/guanylate cyclase domain-containing protein, partial [Gaiellaceae bacterium]|nr:adenylate/guanylate cyclase domain-containing protein [Gaiellaceae bacterium]
AHSDGVNIAYQVAGDGTADLLMIPGWVTHLALDWHEPRWVGWFERMTAFTRIVRFDKRGTGMSDRPPGIPTADERMTDALAVMDAAGLERAHVLGWSEGGPLGVMVAVAYPERVQSLILYGTQARFSRRDDYPFGDEESEDHYGELEREWGSEIQARQFIPDADPAAIRRLAAYYQAGASPSAAAALARANAAIDVRGLLASIRVPTLVLNREHDPVAPGETGRYLAERIPASRFIQLPGSAHAPWLGDAERFCTEVEHFVTGIRPVEREPGAVRTILHCDIVGSTVRAVSLGDERWSELLADYDRTAEQAVVAHGGRIVDRTGDGFMAAFDGPVGAIRAARRLQLDTQELDLQVRAGLHIGEVREEGGLLRGIAVHVAARVMSEAAGGEVLVSETVRDVVAGANLVFSDRGAHELKGIEGQRHLFAVTVESDRG